MFLSFKNDINLIIFFLFFNLHFIEIKNESNPKSNSLSFKSERHFKFIIFLKFILKEGKSIFNIPSSKILKKLLLLF